MLNKVLTCPLTFTSLKPLDLSKCTKDEIKEYFLNSYALNESIFTGLKEESVIYKCPDRLRLPLIFYYGHTACVYMNKLILAGLVKSDERVNFEFESLFETGVDEMSWDDTEHYRMGGSFKWPPLDEVIQYRKKVKDLILKKIADTELKLPVTMESPWWGLFMGMEHERIHLETSSVLIRQLPVSMVTCPTGWIYGPSKGEEPVLDNSMVKVSETKVTLGKPEDFPSYGWDNEYGSWDVTVPIFEASKYMITNREFLDFVLDGGYNKEHLWTPEGWHWVTFREARHPTFWVCQKGCKAGGGSNLGEYTHCTSDNYPGHCNGHMEVDNNGHQGKDEGGGHHGNMENGTNGTNGVNGTSNSNGTTGKGEKFKLRVMYDVIELPLDWPVEVNYHEAKAFCTWKGCYFRLPAEAELNVMRGTQKPVCDGVDCDIIYQDKIDANLNLQYGSSTPVNLYPPNDAGFHDVFGNAWEWVEDHFNGLPGIRTHKFYDDFSNPCFDGNHNCILGGSWMSTGDEASRFARYAFRRHFFQHCGFRICRSLTNSNNGEKTRVPIRLINTNVFILGSGITDDPVTPGEEFECHLIPSTNRQLKEDSELSLNKMLIKEYGNKTNSVPCRIAKLCTDMVKSHKTQRSAAAHVGCGTGAVTFRLGETFNEVVGLDVSGRFIDACLSLQEGNGVSYWNPQAEGAKRGHVEAVCPVSNVKDKVTFKQLTWLPNELGCFDFILLSLLERAENPKAWLLRLPEILKKGGLLAISTSTEAAQKSFTKQIQPRFRQVEPLGHPEMLDAPCVTFWKHA